MEWEEYYRMVKFGLFHFHEAKQLVQTLPCDNIPPIPLWATQYLL